MRHKLSGPSDTAHVTLSNRAIMLVAVAGGFLSLYATQAVGPAMRDDFGLSVREVSTLLTVTTVGLACAAPFSTLVVKRWGQRRTIVACLALLTIAAACLSCIESYPAMLAVRAVQGVIIPFVLAALLASIERHWPGRAALHMSVAYVAGTIIGGVVGRLLPSVAVPALGWTAGMGTLALTHATILVAAARYFPADPMLAPALHEAASAATTERHAVPSIASTAVAGFVLLFSQTAVYTYIAFRLADPPFALPSSTIGLLYLAFLPALLFIGFSRHAVGRYGHSRALVGAVILAWVGLALTLPPRLPAIALGLATISIATFFAQAVLAHAVSINVSRSSQKAAGLYLFSYYLGGSFGAFTPSLLWTAAGWAGCILTVVLLQLVAIVTMGINRGVQIK